jgi:hypothetical protein
VDPGQDLDEGGLAGSVLPEQSVRLAGIQIDGAIGKRHDVAECFRDVPDAQDRHVVIADRANGALAGTRRRVNHIRFDRHRIPLLGPGLIS